MLLCLLRLAELVWGQLCEITKVRSFRLIPKLSQSSVGDFTTELLGIKDVSPRLDTQEGGELGFKHFKHKLT